MKASLLLVGLLACKKDDQKADTESPSETTTEAVTWSYSFVVNASTTSAGEEVGYTSTLAGSDGTTLSTDPTLTSDIEKELSVSSTGITPTVAASHTLAAVLEYEGNTYTSEALLQVTPGPVDALDLILSENTTPAGAPVAATLTAADAYSNPIDTASAALTASSTRVSIDGNQVSATVPGTYEIRGVLGGVQDTEPLSITVGTATFFDLTLSTTDLEVGDTTVADVVIQDDYGNNILLPYTLEVDGGLHTVSGDDITFGEEGLFTVTASADGTKLTDSEGPFLIDSSGPIIDVQNPNRAAWDTIGEADVYGNITDVWSPIADATLNGATLALDPTGDFRETMAYDWGLNIIEVRAEDTDGNRASDSRSLLSGDFLTFEDPLSAGIEVRLNEGTGGLGALEEMGAGLVSPSDLDNMISNPVYQASNWFYEVDINITNPDYRKASLDLDAIPGAMEVTYTIEDATLDYEADGWVRILGNQTASGTISMDSIDIAVTAEAIVLWNSIFVSTQDLEVTITGFDFPMADWLEDALQAFGFDVDATVQGMVEDAVIDSLDGTIGPLIQDALRSFAIDQAIPIGSQDHAMVADPENLTLDHDGLTMTFITTVTPESWTNPHPVLGSLYADFDPPAYDMSAGTHLGISGDFLNQLLLSVWGAGGFEMALTDTDLGISPEDFSLVVPDLTDLTITIDPTLPPQVIPGDEAMYLFQMGSVRFSVYDGAVDPANLRLDAWMAAEASLDFEVDSNMNLVPDLGDLTLVVDVVDPIDNNVSTEEILEAAAPKLLPDLGDLLGIVPLPALGGFALDSATLEAGGAEAGYAVLKGDLVAE